MKSFYKAQLISISFALILLAGDRFPDMFRKKIINHAFLSEAIFPIKTRTKTGVPGAKKHDMLHMFSY